MGRSSYAALYGSPLTVPAPTLDGMLHGFREVGKYGSVHQSDDGREGGDFAEASMPQHRKKRRTERRDYKQLSEGSSEDDPIFEYDQGDEVENPEDGSLKNQTGLKWEFRNSTWQNSSSMYKPPPRPFLGPTRSPTFTYCTLPIFMTLFKLF